MKDRQKAKARIGAVQACASYAAHEAEILDHIYNKAGSISSTQKRLTEKAWIDGYLAGADEMMRMIAAIERKLMETEVK